MVDVTASPSADFLKPTSFVDSDSTPVREFAASALRGFENASPTEKAIRLFDAVRDRIKYDPFHIGTMPDSYRASTVAQRPTNYCVPKAILLAAVLRAIGIPAAPGFADVRNHLTSAKLVDLLGTDLFIYHGYVSLWLDGRMFKVTPAFNTELCQRFGVRELVFDGKSDALFHEFDTQNRLHMQYINDRGWFADPPIDQLLRDMETTYPKLWELGLSMRNTAPVEFAPDR